VLICTGPTQAHLLWRLHKFRPYLSRHSCLDITTFLSFKCLLHNFKLRNSFPKPRIDCVCVCVCVRACGVGTIQPTERRRYGTDDRGIVVRLPSGARHMYLCTPKSLHRHLGLCSFFTLLRNALKFLSEAKNKILRVSNFILFSLRPRQKTKQNKTKQNMRVHVVTQDYISRFCWLYD
jgi:hypothetical protein